MISEVGFALINPHVVSGVQVPKFWQTTQFDDGDDTRIPSIMFSHDGEERVVTPQNIRAALQIATHDYYRVGGR